MGEWRTGTIIALDYREDHWPLGKVVPYQVELDDGAYSHTYGSLICVPADVDAYVRSFQTPPELHKTREFYSWLTIANVPQHLQEQLLVESHFQEQREAAAAAVDAIYGHTWRKQFYEERHADPATGEILSLPNLCITYRADYSTAQIILYWDEMTVFVPTPKGNGKGKANHPVQPEPIAEAAAVQSGIPGTAQQPRQELQKPQQPQKEKPKGQGKGK